MRFCQNNPCVPRCRIVDLRCKEVISVNDGNRIGYVNDVEIDTCTGRIVAIVVPNHGKWCGFGKKNDYVIPWESICRIGDDVILTKFCPEENGSDSAEYHKNSR